MIPRIAPRLVLGIVILLFVLGLVIFGPAACNRYLAEKKAGQIARGQNEATIDTVEEANAVVSRIEKEESEIKAEIKERADEIRNAPAGDSNDVADRGVCRTRAYINSERCAALRAADSRRAP